MAAAPAITLRAIVSKRDIVFNDVKVPTLLMLVTQESSGPLDAVVERIRADYPSLDDLQIANIADLRAFPKILRKVAQTIMNGRYNDAAKRIEPPRNPADHIIILPDWSGKAVRALGFEDVSKQIGVVLLLPGGEMAGSYQGDDPAAGALTLLRAAAPA